MVFRDPPQSWGEGVAEGWRLCRPCVWSLPSQLECRHYPRLGSSRGSHWGLPNQPGSCRTASPPRLSVLSVCLFMCQCCITKHSTWAYPKSLCEKKNKRMVPNLCWQGLEILNEFVADISRFLILLMNIFHCCANTLLWQSWGGASVNQKGTEL